MSAAEMSIIIKDLKNLIELMEYQPDDPMYQDEYASGHFKGFTDGCAYSAGLLRNSKLPTIAKVFVSQIAGRLAYLLTILASIYVFENENLVFSNVLSSMRS